MRTLCLLFVKSLNPPIIIFHELMCHVRILPRRISLCEELKRKECTYDLNRIEIDQIFIPIFRN